MASFTALLIVASFPNVGNAETMVRPPSAEQVAKIFTYSSNLVTKDSENGDYGFGKTIWKRDYSSTNESFGRVSLVLLEGGTYLTPERKKTLEDGVKKGGFYAPRAVDLQGNRRGYIQDSNISFSSPNGKYDVMALWWDNDIAHSHKQTNGSKIIKIVNDDDPPKKQWPERPEMILEQAIQKLDLILFPQQ